MSLCSFSSSFCLSLSHTPSLSFFCTCNVCILLKPSFDERKCLMKIDYKIKIIKIIIRIIIINNFIIIIIIIFVMNINELYCACAVDQTVSCVRR